MIRCVECRDTNGLFCTQCGRSAVVIVVRTLDGGVSLVNGALCDEHYATFIGQSVAITNETIIR